MGDKISILLVLNPEKLKKKLYKFNSKLIFDGFKFGTKDVFGLGEFHEFANIVRIKEECWDFLWGFI